MKLSELEESLLRSARVSLRPTAQDRQRHEAALYAEIHAPAASETGLRPPMHSETRSILGASGALERAAPRLRLGRLQLVSAGVAAGMALGGVIGFAVGRSTSSAGAGSVSNLTEQRDARAASDGPKAHEASPRHEDGDTAAVAAEELLEASDPVAEEPSAPTAITTRRLKPPRARQHEKTRPESSLALELSMLQRARRALAAENGRLALGIVQELEERFPRGVLLEERQATRVLSLCLLGRTDEARRHGGEFLAQHGSSVYAERVRASCAVAGR